MKIQIRAASKVMFSKELVSFIDEVNDYLKNVHIEKRGSYDQEKDVLAQMVKLTEEVGELGNEVLAFNNYQRKEKADKHNKQTLEGEFADVLFTLLILAKGTDVDIENAVENKMKKIKERFDLK